LAELFGKRHFCDHGIDPRFDVGSASLLRENACRKDRQ